MHEHTSFYLEKGIAYPRDSVGRAAFAESPATSMVQVTIWIHVTATMQLGNILAVYSIRTAQKKICPLV
jgi:hypothetical protein